MTKVSKAQIKAVRYMLENKGQLLPSMHRQEYALIKNGLIERIEEVRPLIAYRLTEKGWREFR